MFVFMLKSQTKKFFKCKVNVKFVSLRASSTLWIAIGGDPYELYTELPPVPFWEKNFFNLKKTFCLRIKISPFTHSSEYDLLSYPPITLYFYYIISIHFFTIGNSILSITILTDSSISVNIYILIYIIWSESKISHAYENSNYDKCGNPP